MDDWSSGPAAPTALYRRVTLGIQPTIMKLPIIGQSTAIRFSSGEPFAQYCSAIATTFCPFLGPSEQLGTLLQTHVHIPAKCEEEANELITCAVIARAEALRKRRRTLSPRQALLACDNLIISVEPELTQFEGHPLLDWPHYLAKSLYTGVGLLFGKFWASENDVSIKGIPIPPPPVSMFISIRSAVRERDARFFDQSPELLQSYLTAIDDGRNVHLGHDIDEDIGLIEKMLNEDYYRQLRLRYAIKPTTQA